MAKNWFSLRARVSSGPVFGRRASSLCRKQAAKIRTHYFRAVDMGSALGTVICIFSTKGGVGRTTVAVNLAVAFGLQGRRTALVDFDLQSGAVDLVLGVQPEKTIDDLIQKEDFAAAGDYLAGFDGNLSVL